MVSNISIYLHFDGLFIRQRRDLSLRISINSTNDNTLNRLFPHSFLSGILLSSDVTSQATFLPSTEAVPLVLSSARTIWRRLLESPMPFVYSRNMLLSNIFRLRFCLLSPLDIISCLSFCFYFAFS